MFGAQADMPWSKDFSRSWENGKMPGQFTLWVAKSRHCFDLLRKGNGLVSSSGWALPQTSDTSARAFELQAPHSDIIKSAGRDVHM